MTKMNFYADFVKKAQKSSEALKAQFRDIDLSIAPSFGPLTREQKDEMWEWESRKIKLTREETEKYPHEMDLFEGKTDQGKVWKNLDYPFSDLFKKQPEPEHKDSAINGEIKQYPHLIESFAITADQEKISTSFKSSDSDSSNKTLPIQNLRLLPSP